MKSNFLSSLLVSCLAILGLCVSAGPAHGAPERFTAALASGARIEGDEIRPWHETKAQPRLKDKALFDPMEPVEDIAAVDFLTVPTATFRVLCCCFKLPAM